MTGSSFIRRLAAPVAGLAVVAGLLVAAPSASAAQIGTLTFTGLTAQDVGFTMDTSGPCPAEATNFLIKLEGGNIPVPSAAPNLTGNTAGSTIGDTFNSSAFTATSSKTLEGFALANGLSKLGDGTYTVTLVCRLALASASLGDYVGTFTVSNSGATVTPVAPASPDATTTTLTPSTLTPGWGTPVGMAVTVSNTDTPATKPTGTVAIKEGATVLASGTLVNGAVTIPVPFGLGDHIVTAVYTPADANLFQASTSASSTITASLAAPTLVRAASLSGSIKVGGTAVCSTGTWSGATSYKYEFLKNGVVAQTSTTDFDIVLAAGDLGKTLACRVTGVNPIGDGTPSTTAAVKIAAGSAPVATTKPRIIFSGSAANVGETVKASKGTWSPSATYTYVYIWKRGSTIIKQGTTATSYKLTATDKGKKITLTVQAKRTGYTTGSASSAAVTVK